MLSAHLTAGEAARGVEGGAANEGTYGQGVGGCTLGRRSWGVVVGVVVGVVGVVEGRSGRGSGGEEYYSKGSWMGGGVRACSASSTTECTATDRT
jgi:hypothetical protein